MLKFIERKIKKKELNSEKEFTRCRCPKCNSLMFEKDESIYVSGSVRIKCRMCKEILVL